jgi:hypothetical protein
VSPQFLSALRARGPEIQYRWRRLLRIEPVSGPLANPEALQYLIPQVWNQVLATVAKSSRTPVSLEKARAQLPACNCGKNPYRAFFLAAEQAITEAAVLLQADQPPPKRKPADVAELVFAVRSLARSEIDTFCGACTHRGKAHNCRFASAVS